MQIVPSQRTATCTGAWSALGFVPWDQWMTHQKGTHDILTTNLISLSVFVVFLIVPAFLFVIGTNNGVYSRFWFLYPEQRAAYWVISKRMFCWLAGAVAFGAVWSLALWAFSRVWFS
jgi:hypothetical protein